jgi:VacB/RNase II family 3'-5' exoribonuclease
MNATVPQHRRILERLADKAMTEAGLLAHFSPAALTELSRLTEAAPAGDGVRDLTDLLWCSIDNDDSLDLDQLTAGEPLPQGRARILVAIADVDSLVKRGTAINGHAEHNTTSVYTAARMYPMLPEKLSTGLTSLNLDSDRLALVVDMSVSADGAVLESHIYEATVRNKAKLAYNSVARWLDGSADELDEIRAVPGLAENLRLQDEVAQRMKKLRHHHGALTLQTIEARPVFDGDQLSALETEEKNRAKEIIEDFMVAANGATARFLSASGFASIRRVVRVPKRWDRIVELAARHGGRLPGAPDARALQEFLVQQRAEDPMRFPDLSLSVIKLLGSGEYVVDAADSDAPGHFGLAVKDYAHSTAPNRRYPDLITQRLLKAALAKQPEPYDEDALGELAQHCTVEEDIAAKVERRVGKSAAAILLESRIGEEFDAVVTGAAAKGTWVRLLSVPVEGKLLRGFQGADVGDRLRVQLIETDVEKGYIDFAKV